MCQQPTSTPSWGSLQLENLAVGDIIKFSLSQFNNIIIIIIIIIKVIL